jgi:DNA-binding transcriptional LysR family regulator
MQTTDVSWDDYRLLLATVRGASFQAAAQELGVATSTVSRRIAAWERRLGAPLFERVPHGVQPTAAGNLLAQVAQTLENEMRRGEHRVANLDTGLSGRVRLTAGEGFGDALMPLVAQFRADYPQIDLELAIDSRMYDLSKGEADLALRIPKPSEPGLRARKLLTLRFGLFASAKYLARRGVPGKVSELERHDLIGFSGQLSNMLAARLWSELGVKHFSVRVNSTPLLRLAVENQLGIGILVTSAQGLTRVLPQLETPAVDVWLARHPSTLGVRRIDRLAEFLSEHVRRLMV